MKDLTDKMLKKLAEKVVGKKASQQELLENDTDSHVYTPSVMEQQHFPEPTELIERTKYRLFHQEIERQKNIEDILERADEELAKEKEVKNEEVEVDNGWVSRFFGIVQDVSKEEMKTIWAKILAKEIERPSSFSMRTLEVLRNISYEEAKLFARISELVFVQDQMSFIFHNGNKYGLNYYNLSKLREAGLMQSGEQVTRTFTASKANSKYTHIFVCGNKYIELTTEHDTNDIVVPVCLLTQAGCELYELTEYRDNMGYLKDFAAFVRKENPSASVKYGDVLERKGHQIKYKLPLIEL